MCRRSSPSIEEAGVKAKALTREMIEAGAIDAIVARDAPAMRILSDAERAASLLETLKTKPRDDVWLFGYGSLIWNPTVEYVERRVAKVVGWRRSFCLATPAGRGSVDNPGLVLGLDAGGDCTGVAFRIAGHVVEAELATLWKREMLAASYIPRWLDLHDEQGSRFGCGLAFAIDPGGQNYAGDLTRQQIVARLATACGALGSSADYLFETCKGLREHAIRDLELEALEAEVTAYCVR
jgi:cation transport protein ChaC